uniref:AraC family transcriptional regulator n=1 Tax=Stenotrophomonas maltophilia TaxID=40324 RepID=UPI0013D970FF
AQGLYEPLVCFVVQGRKRVTFGSQLFDYDAAKYLIASVDLPASGEIAEASAATPYLAVALRLDPAML